MRVVTETPPNPTDREPPADPVLLALQMAEMEALVSVLGRAKAERYLRLIANGLAGSCDAPSRDARLIFRERLPELIRRATGRRR